MKSALHAVAGVTGFLLVSTFLVATLSSELLGGPEAIAQVKLGILLGMPVLILALLGAGASGVSLLGKRTEPLALTKQKRGPVAFMTSLFVLLPCSYFLWSWSSDGSFGALFYGVQAVELLASAVALTMISLNIWDGLALRGRVGAGAVKAATIQQREGGPLVAFRLPVLNADGAPVPTRPAMALCRCGASKNKPFCDGSHNAIGFDSTPSDDRSKDEVLTYEGKEITIHYNRLLCSHAAECGTRQKAAFDSSRKPWIVPDNASVEAIQEVVRACPSGALRFSLPGGEPQHSVAEEQSVTVEQDGPYRVVGVPLATPRLADGASAHKYVLCRCGASKNKPYCDGSHYDTGWTASAS